jgi:hypothetical protein
VEILMKKLLLLAAAILAFKGGRGAARPVTHGAPGRWPGVGELLAIFLAPRWLRLPMLARALLARRKAPPQRIPHR